jgi:hypothetical protein
LLPLAQWNDARIASLNPSLALPAKPITTIARDNSAITLAFTTYLCKVSPHFAATIGAAQRVQWPAGTVTYADPASQLVALSSVSSPLPAFASCRCFALCLLRVALRCCAACSYVLCV